MCHPRYCLAHHPGISSNTTDAIHFSTPATPTTLEHRPLYPHWCTTHVTHAGTSPQHATHHNPRQHVTRTGTSHTPAHHQCKHTTHVSTPPTQVRHRQHSRQHKQHAICQTRWYPVKLLKRLRLKFQAEITQKFLLAGFTFTFYFYSLSLYFLGLFKHFHRSVEKCNRKIKLFQRKLVCLIQKTTIFSKTNP